MPKLRRKSYSQNQLADRLQKRQSRNNDHLSLQHEPSLGPKDTTLDQPLESTLCQDGTTLDMSSQYCTPTTFHSDSDYLIATPLCQSQAEMNGHLGRQHEPSMGPPDATLGLQLDSTLNQIDATLDPTLDCTPTTFHNGSNCSIATPLCQSQTEMCVGLHEYSFSGINIDEVLNGDIDVRVMDYTSQLLRVQFQYQYGMLPPSYLHYLVTKGEEIPVKIPSGIKAIQMHYITGHYVLSARQHDNVHVFDSLPSQNHLDEVVPQLELLHENFNINCLQYTTSQHQGSTSLCGIFVVANAIILLNNKNRHKYSLLTHKMRSHFQQCLMNSEITVFPTTQYSSLLNSYFEDQRSRTYTRREHSKSKANEKFITLKDNKSQKRQDFKYRVCENDMRRKRRANDAYRLQENEKRRKTRENVMYKNAENMKRNKIRQEKRCDMEYKNTENMKRNITLQKRRCDTEYRNSENVKRTKIRQEKRCDTKYRNSENMKRTKIRQEKRCDTKYRNSET